MKIVAVLCLCAGVFPAAPLTGSYVSSGARITFQEFCPRTQGAAPAIIFLHGADGIGAHRELYEATASQLAEHGYAVFLVDYFDRTGTRRAGLETMKANFLPWMLTVSDAITHVSALPEVDRNRIGLFGTSLGAALALSVASQDARVSAVAEVSGLLPDAVVPLMHRMPPTLILHGTEDPVVPVSEAHKLEQFLTKRGVEHESQLYAGEGHIFSEAAARKSVERIAGFFARTMPAPGPAHS